MDNKPEHLVVDTTAFIQNAPLQEMGQNIVTIQDVVDEITSKRQLKRLVVLPYELKIMDVFPENITFVTEFSKKTGDYLSLSATDIKLMALVYQLEKQHLGTDHLKTTPEKDKVVSLQAPQLSCLDPAGFFKGDISPQINPEDKSENPSLECENNRNSSSDKNDLLNEKSEEIKDGTSTDNKEDNVKPDIIMEDRADELGDNFSELNVNNVLSPVSDEEYESEDYDEEDDDDSDWITPENVKQVKRKMDFGLTEDKKINDGCLTTDFAMQNVLKQIGLNVVGLDGRVIKHLRTFIFRCYSCFKTTSNMTKVFCPKCGYKTLKKVAVSVDENGQQVIHINPRKPLTARGKRFPLPMPKGGKHSNNPVLCEDQPMPDQRPTRLARTKTNPLDTDYIAGVSPFVMRDVNSKSAMLGIRGKNQQVKYWMRKNPNEVVKYGKKKK